MALKTQKLRRLVIMILMVSLWGNLVAEELREPNGFCQYRTADAFYSHWQQLTFPNISRHTEYQWLKNDTNCHVHATANASASGLIYKTRLNLSDTPFIQWSWKINHTLQKGDSRIKSGDDYAARLYVAFEPHPEKQNWLDKLKRLSIQLLYDETLPGNVINYIWANKLTINQTVPNAYIDSSRMIAIQSGNEKAGKWQFERRNLQEDYKNLFGEMPPPIIGIAIMTDTDNTGEYAEAWYGPIVFSTNE